MNEWMNKWLNEWIKTFFLMSWSPKKPRTWSLLMFCTLFKMWGGTRCLPFFWRGNFRSSQKKDNFWCKKCLVFFFFLQYLHEAIVLQNTIIRLESSIRTRSASVPIKHQNSWDILLFCIFPFKIIKNKQIH